MAPHPPTSDSSHSQGSYRTLNVKDALSYLEQVKHRFKDQNEVYNQFLDVMKLFKNQSIDTPGVIERVSTLFRGYPSLIQGFNTFLPPGFRIECSLVRQIHPKNQEADLVTFYTPGEITHKTSLFPRDLSPAIILTNQPIGSLPPGWIHVSTQSECSSPENAAESPTESSNIQCSATDQPSISSPDAEQPKPTILPVPSEPANPSQKPPKSDTSCHDASRSTSPLEQDHPRPHSQNSHLSAPSQASHRNPVASHEASSSTSKPSSRNPQTNHPAPSIGSLSRGPSPSMIASHVPNAPTTTMEHTANSRLTPSIPTSQALTTGQHYSTEPTSSSNSTLPIAPDLTATDSSLNPTKQHSVSTTKSPVFTGQNSTLPPHPQASVPPHQPAPNAHLNNNKPVEFNYAINYVNKIKHRFIDQPEIYKTFLEILQTYQRDGMPIDSVYVKVTKLFSNAVDLLDEFKQFLPDLNASTAMGQVPKHTFPPPPKTLSAPKHPSGTPSSSSKVASSSAKHPHEQLNNSPFVPHPQSLAHASSSTKPNHRVTQDTLTQNQSQFSLQNNPPNCDSTRHPSKKVSPSRSQNRGSVPPTFARVASPDLPMVLDPQVLSSTTTNNTLDPQVVNHAHPHRSKMPLSTGTPSTNQSNKGLMANIDTSPRRSALPDSLPLHQKRFLGGNTNPTLPGDESFEPPRKKRAFGGPLKNPGQHGSNPSITKDPTNNLAAESDATAFPSAAPIAKKTKRSKSKNTNADLMAPTNLNESLPQMVPTFLEQHRSSWPHYYEEIESTSRKVVSSSDQYKHSSNTLPHQVVDRSSTMYGNPQLQLAHSSHPGRSTLTDYSIWQPSYIETHDAMGGRTLTNTKELTLFESIKKYLHDQELWLEFLRVLDLYNQSIIDFKTLLDRVSVFIGDDDELLEDFKGLVGYDVKNDGLVEGEVWEIKNQDIKERDKVDASMIQKEYGPSYKRLPRAEIDLACSGRDELCWSVLNDEYFGAAKFGTESGGPGHRKTNFEEVIAMTEGERAHFSYWLECISRTIGHFEALQSRIDRMEDQDKANFNLGENLGGISPSIYHRTLRKVYEAKHQTTILPYLRDYPVNTIPIVLRRLKELELSWKSAESQWNLIWREVERKNYYKAQDHQVLGFKSAEKSLLKGQNLLKEIQDLKSNNQETVVYTVSMKEGDAENNKDSSKSLEDQSSESSPHGKVPIMLENKIPEKIIESPSPSRVSHQIELGFEDIEVFFDVLRIIIMALDRSTLSNPERRRIDESIRTFIPAIWNISSSELEKQIPIIYDDESSDEPSEVDGGNPNQSNQNGVDGQTPTMDQRKQSLLDQKGIQTLTEGLLKIQQTTHQETSSEQRHQTRSQNLDTPMSSPSHSYQLTPAEYVSSSNHVATTCVQDHHAALVVPNNNSKELNQSSFTDSKKWIKLSILDNPPDLVNAHDQNQQRLTDGRSAKYYNVFGTSTYYVLIRLLHILYSRLLKLKTIGVKLSEEKPKWRRINPVAIELGLSHPIIGLDDHPYPSTQLYPYCLDQLSRYFDGEIDFNSFEESIRVAFPKHGYLLSTVDKLTNSILKQFAQIHQEPKNKELLYLLKRERSLNSNFPMVQINYRNQAESIIRPEDGEREETTIRAEWHPDRMSLSVQILNEDDATFELLNPIDRLTHYIHTFELDIDSELVQLSKVRKPFLRANLNLVHNEDKDDDSNNGDSNKNDEGNQSSQNTIHHPDAKLGKHHHGTKEDTTQNQIDLVDQKPVGLEGEQEDNKKLITKPQRVIIINKSKIRTSIDPKTYKLKFGNAGPHHHPIKSSTRNNNNQEEATDLLFVKTFNSTPSPPSSDPMATNNNNQQQQNCFRNSCHLQDVHRVKKFQLWLSDYYQQQQQQQQQQES